jgi:hypothetical protein
MNSTRRTLATLEVVLIFPAALFLTALFVRNLQPAPFEPAHTAQRIVDWYAARTHVGLWLFMMALPLAVLTIGCVTLIRSWRSDPALRRAALQCARAVRPYFDFLIVALATAASAAILVIVAVHLMAG